jgi:hypothetical protein
MSCGGGGVTERPRPAERNVADYSQRLVTAGAGFGPRASRVGCAGGQSGTGAGSFQGHRFSPPPQIVRSSGGGARGGRTYAQMTLAQSVSPTPTRE